MVEAPSTRGERPKLHARGVLEVLTGVCTDPTVSCTIASFLAIVASSFRAGSVLAGFGLFVAYAVGNGLLVGVTALAVAVARPAALTGLRRSGPVLSRIGGVILLVAGSYVAYYGPYQLSGRVDEPVVAAAHSVQRRWSARSRRRAPRGSRRSSACCSPAPWWRERSASAAQAEPSAPHGSLPTAVTVAR